MNCLKSGLRSSSAIISSKFNTIMLCNTGPRRKSSDLINCYSYRSHNCGQLRVSHEGKMVTLCGWVSYQRMGKFITIRDAYGMVQLVIPDAPASSLSSRNFKKLPLESVVCAKGIVSRRPDHSINPKMSTGEIEVILSDLKVIGPCKSNLPFQLRDYQKANEQLRLKYRYLDLRNYHLQNNLRIRAAFLSRVREFLDSYGFIEIETPTLFKKTPGVSILQTISHIM